MPHLEPGEGAMGQTDPPLPPPAMLDNDLLSTDALVKTTYHSCRDRGDDGTKTTDIVLRASFQVCMYAGERLAGEGGVWGVGQR